VTGLKLTDDLTETIDLIAWTEMTDSWTVDHTVFHVVPG